MTETNTTGPVHLDVFVRSFLPRRGDNRQRRILQKLSTLDSSGVIDSYEVIVWGRQIPALYEDAWTPGAQQALDRVRVFREWARRNNLSISEAFMHGTTSSMIAEEETETIVLPEVALAEYHGADLYFVAPCESGTSHCTVEDRLDAIAGVAESDVRDVTPVERIREEISQPEVVELSD